MKNELNELLNEIELIIASIAVFDSNKFKISYKERHKLTQLFHNKLKQAQKIKKNTEVKLAS